MNVKCFFDYLIKVLTPIVIAIIGISYSCTENCNRKINIELWTYSSKYKYLTEYKDRIDHVFNKNSLYIINMFNNIKDEQFINNNYNLVLHIYLTKVVYDLTNDSYEQYFMRNSHHDVYLKASDILDINDHFLLSNIFFNDDYKNITEQMINNIIENKNIFITDNKKEYLNYLLTTILDEKETILSKIEENYKNNLFEYNLDKDLIFDYYKLNDNYRGLTQFQKQLYKSSEYEKQNIIDFYINTYFNQKLFKTSFMELTKKSGE